MFKTAAIRVPRAHGSHQLCVKRGMSSNRGQSCCRSAFVKPDCDGSRISTSLFAAEGSFLDLYHLPPAPPPDDALPLEPPLLPPEDEELLVMRGMVTISSYSCFQFLQVYSTRALSEREVVAEVRTVRVEYMVM